MQTSASCSGSFVWLEPDWPAPPGIRAASTLRPGGVSLGCYASLNLGAHVGDDPLHVTENRRRLSEALGLPGEPCWLQQVHGHTVIRSGADWTAHPAPPAADAAHTSEKAVVCGVMTADCLPVLLCSADGASVAAVHAGWRGLASGIIEATVSAMDCKPGLAWLGPALGQQAFEVGDEVRNVFLQQDARHADCFKPGSSEGKWLADLYGLARRILHGMGVTAVYGGEYCTASEPDRFFSYRRDHTTGRMATLIWRE